MTSMHESFIIELHDRYQKYQIFIVVPQVYTIQNSSIFFFPAPLMGIIKKDIALMDVTVKILWLLTSCLEQSCGCLNTPMPWFHYVGNYHSWFYLLLNKVFQSFCDPLFSYHQPSRHCVTSSLLPRWKRLQSKDSDNYFSSLCNLGSISNGYTFL